MGLLGRRSQRGLTGLGTESVVPRRVCATRGEARGAAEPAGARPVRLILTGAIIL
jgi:hypothetical protein